MCGSSVHYPVYCCLIQMNVHQSTLIDLQSWEFSGSFLLPIEKPVGFSRLQNLTKFFMPAY